ncbi:MAG: hypothetical protein CMR00_06445 [[Chlorobium] sp. 445]|nr:MAG: hypothetical protein CMR00_06445 [[Chlorobium] sp. 445]
MMGLTGSFQIENAEQLSFRDEQFDFVYSHGCFAPHPQSD